MHYYGTLGPACQQADTLHALFSEGMTGVRLNLSHAGLNACRSWLDQLHTAAARAGVRPALLIDLQGPELRIGALAAPLALEEGALIRFGAGGIPLHTRALDALTPGQKLLLDDGALLLEAVTQGHGFADCRVLRGGTLAARKSAALPGADIHPPTLTAADLENLALAKSCGVTGVMLPFVRDAEDLCVLRDALANAGASEIRVLAKLENRAGVDRLETLLPGADEIVIARGDLGNDLPLWELPRVQKQVSAQCKRAGMPFMVVTQLLHSMHQKAVPTRAEVLDIYNAVLDGASSLMLTGETATGLFPVDAMRYLVRTAQSALAERGANPI